MIGSAHGEYKNAKDHKIGFHEMVIRSLLIIGGTFFLLLGIVGIFIPILPTTPFLLLAAACYSRGSKWFYRWLVNNRVFGSYIKNYREGRGMALRAKVITITLLWIMILVSALVFITSLWVRVLLLAVAVGVTVHILLIKNYKPDTN